MSMYILSSLSVFARNNKCARALSKTARWSSTYKAAILSESNKPLKIEEIKSKKLKPGQVRLKVKSCAVNASDYLLMEGMNQGKISLPVTPGYEMSGTILECKECKSVAKGDRVVALNKDDLGGFAEECVVNEKDVWGITSSLSFANAAALVDSFGTALLGLSRHGHLLQKQVVIVTMAPAHGYAPLDIAANVYKTKVGRESQRDGEDAMFISRVIWSLQVIAVTMSESETEAMRERGAWSALSFTEKRLLSAVKDLTGGRGVDVIYDTLAGDVLKTCLKCVTHEGHILVAGNTLQDLPQIGISELLSLPSFYVSGVSLRSYREHAFKTYRQTVSDVLEMSDQGLIKPNIAHKFLLKDINKALEMIKEKQPIGKMIIEMGD